MRIPYGLLVLSLVSPVLLSAQSVTNTADDHYYENTIIHSTRNSSEHTTLLNAFIAADLDQLLNSDGPFTIFAPSDAAFKKIPEDKIKELLLPHNKSKLHALLTYHVIAGNFTASEILRAMSRGGGEAIFTTVQGNKLKATMDGIDIVLSDSVGNEARITVADNNQCNGVIHVIDGVVLPRKI